MSSRSTDSVSTISTDRSLSPKRARRDVGDRYFHSQQESDHLPRYPSKDRKRRRKSSSPLSESRSDSSSIDDRRKGNGRRRHRTVSPKPRGRPTEDRRGSRRSRSRSRSQSKDQRRVARDRKSMTPMPASADHTAEHHPTPRGQENRPAGRRGNHDSRMQHDHDISHRREEPMRKERSLSPYSKRIALTQAMNSER